MICFIASLLTILPLGGLHIASGPDPYQQPSLPNPFILMKEETAKGNPLAQYAEMLRLEPEYLKDVGLVEAYSGTPLKSGLASSYAQARATVEGNLGAIRRSLRSQAVGWFYARPGRAVTESSLDSKTPVGAVDYIVAQAAAHSWIMIGEEHMKPQTRTLLLPLLRRLKAEGFSYFAAEAFYPKIDETVSNGAPTWESGFYTQDPIYAEAIREALKLGYKLVEYEAREHPAEARPGGDAWYAQNFREHQQAKNLKERIYDVDPKAKVLVWAGRSHVVKVASKQPDGEFRPMGYEFKRMTGVDPLSVYLPTNVEFATSEFETADFKYATDKGWVDRPTIFVGRDGEAHGLGDGEVTVFFPRTNYVRGRPDWLVSELGRVSWEIPAAMIKADGYLLAQAWLEGESVKCVPVDQILIVPGEPLPVLMVPSGTKLWMRVIDASGSELGTAHFRT